jgi:hypothetical protein
MGRRIVSHLITRTVREAGEALRDGRRDLIRIYAGHVGGVGGCVGSERRQAGNEGIGERVARMRTPATVRRARLVSQRMGS